MSFQGLNVLVTGSSSGLGASTARQIAADGARVIVNYSSSEAEAEATAQQCRDAGALEVLVVQGDVSKDEDCLRLAAAAEPWGGLNALVNNAGTTKHVPDHSQLDQLSAEDFQRIYSVNVIGPYQMIRAARSLLEAGARASGKASAVVNVSSIAGLSGVGSSVAYAASKGALNTMTISLGRALAPAIRVNAVCPGYIDTPWFSKGRGQESADAMRVAVAAGTPLQVASGPDDIAQVVTFLASPASGHMTGELVRMDAGSHLGRR
ncbi:MAG: 3-oxoacyl-acyl carrier protein reductase [Jatrophihabitantaceae bacterium]|nr:3-oxoacyl-acyl carrier protein reductase [Jatrophihabitantaceae bacterium]